MVIMAVRLSNFLAFNDFYIDFSYPKKLVKTYLENECIKGYPRFRYKKLVILLGANASGKTSLGQMVNRILNFIVHKSPDVLIEAVRDTAREAELTLDFVVAEPNPELYRIGVKIVASVPKCSVYVKSTGIKHGDTYETAKKRLDACSFKYTDNYTVLRKVPALGFFFSYPSDVKPSSPHKTDSENYLRVLETILKVLDTSIIRIERVREARNSYSINFLGGSNVLIQNGSAVNTSLLSSGTKAGIAIADMLTAIMEHANGFYYCDERFPYIQSDVECSILSLMTEYLGDNEQLFFTTQNTDILSLPYPKHSYMFLKKTVVDSDVQIETISADKYLKRNTDVLRRAVENDLFLTAPDIDKLLTLSKEHSNAE